MLPRSKRETPNCVHFAAAFAVVLLRIMRSNTLWQIFLAYSVSMMNRKSSKD